MSNQQHAPQSDDDVKGVAAYFIKNRVISWMLSLIFLIGGVSAFFDLGRLEGPRFYYQRCHGGYLLSWSDATTSGRRGNVPDRKSDSAINLC